jgi:hypothetical protein
VTLTASEFFSTAPAELGPEAEERFFCAIRTSNRTTKQTAQNRFNSLNDKLLARLSDCTIDEVLDVGISSGVTTIELVESLRTIGVAPRVTATDRWSHAYLVPVGWNCGALLDEDCEVLQLELFGRAMRSWSRRLDYITGMALVRRAATAIIGARARRVMRDPSRRARPVELVTPRLRAIPQISLTKDDVLVFNAGFARRFDFIRAANILNKGYFPSDALSLALSHLASYLRGPGAWLLVNRTHPDETNHGTLFRLDEQRRLRAVERFGDGSEIEALVLNAEFARP